MYVSLKTVIIFFIIILIYYGVWQFVWLKLTKKYYNILKNEGESYFDFLCRWSTSPVWGIKRKLGFDKFYRFKVFDLFVKIKGTILVLLGLAIALALHFALKTDYAVWLNMRF